MEKVKETKVNPPSQVKFIGPPLTQERARESVKSHNGRAAYVKQFHHPYYSLGILRFDEKSHDCFYFTRLIEGEKARKEMRIAYDDLEGMLVGTNMAEALREEQPDFPEEGNYP